MNSKTHSAAVQARLRLLEVFGRLEVLRYYGAPKCLIKNEQVKLVRLRWPNQDIEPLLDKHVRPFMDGKGYITFPDGEKI